MAWIEDAYRGDETGPDPRKRGGPTEAYSYTPQGEPERADDGDGPVSSARRQPFGSETVDGPCGVEAKRRGVTKHREVAALGDFRQVGFGDFECAEHEGVR